MFLYMRKIATELIEELVLSYQPKMISYLFSGR